LFDRLPLLFLSKMIASFYEVMSEVSFRASFIQKVTPVWDTQLRSPELVLAGEDGY